MNINLWLLFCYVYWFKWVMGRVFMGKLKRGKHLLLFIHILLSSHKLFYLLLDFFISVVTFDINFKSKMFSFGMFSFLSFFINTIFSKHDKFLIILSQDGCIAFVVYLKKNWKEKDFSLAKHLIWFQIIEHKHEDDDGRRRNKLHFMLTSNCLPKLFKKTFLSLKINVKLMWRC